MFDCSGLCIMQTDVAEVCIKVCVWRTRFSRGGVLYMHTAFELFSFMNHWVTPLLFRPLASELQHPKHRTFKTWDRRTKTTKKKRGGLFISGDRINTFLGISFLQMFRLFMFLSNRQFFILPLWLKSLKVNYFLHQLKQHHLFYFPTHTLRKDRNYLHL